MGLKDTDIRDLDLFNSKQKKPTRFLTKKGINLAADYDARNRRLSMILGSIIVVVVVFAVAKFGVYDLIDRRNAAISEYTAVHVQYEDAQQKLVNYDEVLLEYRTYSMEWMENDTSGKYVSVPRREILNMIEKNMMKKGDVSEIEIEGDSVIVTMSGMNLKEISKMCTKLEELDFVEDATLQTASSENGVKEDNEDLTFVIMIQLHSNEVEQAAEQTTEEG